MLTLAPATAWARAVAAASSPSSSATGISPNFMTPLSSRGLAPLEPLHAQHGRDLAEDRNRDLRRREGADIEADRPMDAREIVGSEARIGQPLAARGMGFARSQRA